MVKLMDVVSFHFFHVILRKLIHYSGEIFVYGTEDCNAHRIVACPEKSLASFFTCLFHIIAMLLEPSCAAAHNLHSCFPSPKVIAICRRRSSELNSNVSTCKCLALKVVLIVNVNDAHDLMTATEGNTLYHLAHFPISDKCNFHILD